MTLSYFIVTTTKMNKINIKCERVLHFAYYFASQKRRLIRNYPKNKEEVFILISFNS